MRILQKTALISTLLGSLGLGSSFALAADTPAAGAMSTAKDIVLRGDAKCTRCHDESDEPRILTIGLTRHGVKGDSRTPTCTSCHGDSDSHVDKTGSGDRPAPDRVFNKTTPADSKNAPCLSCHEKSFARTHWAGSAHQVNDVACVSCHGIHNNGHDKVREKRTQAEVCFTCHKEQRADSHKISHHPIGEGKVVCSDCHNPHGSAGPKLLKKNTVTETCTLCHAEKRGPFLWEHQPVSEDCTNCHTPHGSNITPLLKSRPPFLCQECHDAPHQAGNPVGPAAAGKYPGSPFTGSPSSGRTGRACLNCHVQIHGGNSPAGGYRQR